MCAVENIFESNTAPIHNDSNNQGTREYNIGLQMKFAFTNSKVLITFQIFKTFLRLSKSIHMQIKQKLLEIM